jgi:hypothetical protein
MLIAAQAREVRKDERSERLEKLVAAFKQAAFGRKSEKGNRRPRAMIWPTALKHGVPSRRKAYFL